MVSFLLHGQLSFVFLLTNVYVQLFMKAHISVKCFILKELFLQTMSSIGKISVHVDPRHSECLGDTPLSWGKTQ